MCLGKSKSFAEGFTNRRLSQLPPVARPEFEAPEFELGPETEEDIKRKRLGRKRFQIGSASLLGKTSGVADPAAPFPGFKPLAKPKKLTGLQRLIQIGQG